MKKVLNIFILLLVGIVLVTNAYAQLDNVGTSAANFLKIGIGARAQGMSNAYVAQADEVTALFWNPAGISNISGHQVGFTQVDWITDVKLNFLGASFSAGSAGKIGVAITYLSMGDMKKTNFEHPEGTGETFTAGNLCLGITWARQITNRFNFGIQAKYIQEKISQSSGSAFAIDIGTQYLTGFHGLKIGMAITNFGTKIRLEGRDLDVRHDPYPTLGSNPDDVWANLETVEWQLPIAMRLGLSMDFVKNHSMRVTGNFDFVKERDFDQMWCAGGEVSFLRERVFIRGGLTPHYEDELRASFGAGVKYDINSNYGFILDYAYSDMGRLENANRFSLAITF